ncbi:hypothetical protein ROTAS13_04383 [Roseomonas sp. TAS13]|nr:hypothetical protein ROTAS13_04383 [Roseomonas sp. TAS13]
MARKMARSRAGKGAPSGDTSGRVSTPARVIAPFTPASAMTATRCQLGRSGERPFREACSRMNCTEIQTQAKRSAARPRVMAMT